MTIELTNAVNRETKLFTTHLDVSSLDWYTMKLCTIKDKITGPSQYILNRLWYPPFYGGTISLPSFVQWVKGWQLSCFITLWPYQFRSNTKLEHNNLLCPLLPPFQNGEKHCNQQNFKNYIRFDWMYSTDSSIHSKYIDMFQYFSDSLHMYVYDKKSFP